MTNARHLWKRYLTTLYIFFPLFSKPKSEARVSVTQKQYAALFNPKMYPHTKLWIPTSHIIQILSGLDLSRRSQWSMSQIPENSRWHTVANRCIHLPNLKVICHIIKEICSVFDFIRVAEVRGQGHNCPKVVRYNLNMKMHPHTKFDIDT